MIDYRLYLFFTYTLVWIYSQEAITKFRKIQAYLLTQNEVFLYCNCITE